MTADGTLRHQQNLRKAGIAALVIARVRNRIELRPLLAQIVAAIRTTEVGR